MRCVFDLCSDRLTAFQCGVTMYVLQPSRSGSKTAVLVDVSIVEGFRVVVIRSSVKV